MQPALLQIVNDFATAMDGSATNEELRGIREKMDSWAFRENARIALHGLNDPVEIGRLRDAFRSLQRSAEELQARRTNSRELFRIGGFGGGIAVVGGGIVAAVTAATPAVLILPIIGATMIAWQSVVHSSRSNSEIGLLGQISEIARELADWKDF